MIKHSGEVVRIEATTVYVELTVSSACSGCHAKAVCGVDESAEKIVEVEGLTVTDEEMDAECEALAKQYDLTVEKIKEMVPVEEIKASLKTRKAVKVITESAVAVAPKAE